MATRAKKTMTGRQAVLKVLADGQPRKTKEITSAAVKLATNMAGKTPEATLGAFLYTEAKKEAGLVEQVGKGEFRLRGGDPLHPGGAERPSEAAMREADEHDAPAAA